MWSVSTELPKYRYSPIDDGTGTTKGVGVMKRSWSVIVFKLVGLLLVIFAAFVTGRHWPQTDLKSPVHLDIISEVFWYNESFGEPPSIATDTAWKSLFPEQGGFFKHPTLAPDRSAFSVFHQLHCLNGIREGYWTLYEAVTEGKQLNAEDLPMMSTPLHIRHCVDLLRQSLMCNPDLTIELKDKEVGGVTGFGTEHQCKSWDQLMQWTTTWQTYKQDPKDTATDRHKHTHGMDA